MWKEKAGGLGRLCCDCCGNDLENKRANEVVAEIPFRREIGEDDLGIQVRDTGMVMLGLKIPWELCKDCVPYILRYVLRRVEDGEAVIREIWIVPPPAEVKEQSFKEDSSCTLEP